MTFIHVEQLLVSSEMIKHYSLSYHIHHASLILSYINIIMQIICIKGRAWTCVALLLDQIN